MGSVVPFGRVVVEPFPSLWPTEGFQTVVHTLYRNTPEERQPVCRYHYVLKPDLAGVPSSVIIQPNEAVMYRSGYKKQVKNEPFDRWYSRYYDSFVELSKAGFRGTIVGKMGARGSEEVFCCYYVIQGREVTLDVARIEKLTKARQKLFDETLIPMEVMKHAVVTVDKTKGDITAHDMFDTPGVTSYVGLPYTLLEPLVDEYGDVISDLPPRLYSTDIHMRSMAFQFQKARAAN